LGNGLMVIPVLTILYGCGLGFAAYYAEHPELRATLSSPDRVLPHFTVNVLPVGLRGLVLAGIFAATMSSISAGINSVATSVTKDFLVRFRLIGRERELLSGRIVSFGWGILATGSAMLLVNWQLTIIEKFASMYSYFAGPLVGMFLLGVMTQRTLGWHAITGAISGMLTALAIGSWTSVHWLWYGPTGCLITLTLGVLLSLTSKPPTRDLSDFTFSNFFWNRRKDRRLPTTPETTEAR
jgi:Na+/proline symporter